jgi:hypothetical protein
MSKALFYHWWAEPSDDPRVCRNLRSPLILAIATFRAHNHDIPVTVLNASDVPLDWGDYPDRLGFRVVDWKCRLERYGDKAGWRLLSRLFDLEMCSNESQITLYSDADVFWFADVEPLHADPTRFCFDGSNTGFFYYDGSSPIVMRFFEIFRAYTIAALNNGEVREMMKRYVGYTGWPYVFDEQIITFMLHEHPELFHRIGLLEHTAARSLHLVDRNRFKMFHANGTMVHNRVAKHEGEREHSRGLLCLVFEELYDAICRVLTAEEVQEIFTRQERDYYLPRQFSLRKQPERFLATRGEDPTGWCPSGHHYLHKCLLP